MLGDTKVLDDNLKWQERNRYISHICDQVYAHKVSHEEWCYFMQYAHPSLKQTMLKYVFQRAAGLHNAAYRTYWGKDPE